FGDAQRDRLLNVEISRLVVALQAEAIRRRRMLEGGGVDRKPSALRAGGGPEDPARCKIRLDQPEIDLERTTLASDAGKRVEHSLQWRRRDQHERMFALLHDHRRQQPRQTEVVVAVKV